MTRLPFKPEVERAARKLLASRHDKYIALVSCPGCYVVGLFRDKALVAVYAAQRIEDLADKSARVVARITQPLPKKGIW